MKQNLKSILYALFLSILGQAHLQAADITGTVYNESGKPIAGANVSILTPRGRRTTAVTQTAADGTFVLTDVDAGKYTFRCTHVGYADYEADLQITRKKQALALGTVVMHTQDTQLGEVTVEARRNVFAADRQTIYPTTRQTESSASGLDLLQRLPIPLLEVNPISRTVSSLDPSGGIALLINDIPATANDVVILDPKQVKRVEVIRKPGMEYGSDLAMAVNIVMRQAKNGINLGMNTSNSTQVRYGYNNAYATYNHKNSQLTINQSENYQNHSRQTSDDLRHYLLPDGERHEVHIRSLSARTLSATHGTTLKYNLTQPERFVMQVQGSLHLQGNPKQERTRLVSETGKADHTGHSHIRDRYRSPAASLYFKKYMPRQQTLVLNAVGTHIRSDYDYLYEQTEDGFLTSYGVDGRKTSAIGEMRYSKGLKWGSLSAGLRSHYGNTRNRHTGSTDSHAGMVNVNSNAYAQIDGRWKRLSGRAALALEDQYYTQQDERYHKQTFAPHANLNCTVSSSISLAYGFSLASRLPSLGSMNGDTIRLDQWEQPLQRGGTDTRVETTTDMVHKMVRQRNPEAGNHVLLTLSWRWNHGIKSKAQEAELDNKDSDAGILK